MIGFPAEVLRLISDAGRITRAAIVTRFKDRHPDAIDRATGLLMRGGVIVKRDDGWELAGRLTAEAPDEPRGPTPEARRRKHLIVCRQKHTARSRQRLLEAASLADSGLAIAEIAERLSLSYSAAAKRVARGRRLLETV